MKVGIHVADVASVNSHRGKQSCILCRPRQVRAHVSVLEEDGPSRVAALDRSVKVIPLVYPAHWGRWLLQLIERGDALAPCDFAQQCERSIENAAIRGAGDDKRLLATKSRTYQGIGVTPQIGARLESRLQSANLVDSSDNNRRVPGNSATYPQGAVEHAVNSAQEFGLRGFHQQRVVEDNHYFGQR